ILFNMKKSSIYIAIMSLGLGLMGCDKDFEEININPVLSETIDPSFMFSNAVLNSAINTIRYDGAIVQQINTPFAGVLQGGNHNVWFEISNSSSPFQTFYTQPIKYLAEVIEHTKDD